MPVTRGGSAHRLNISGKCLLPVDAGAGSLDSANEERGERRGVQTRRSISAILVWDSGRESFFSAE